MCNNKKHITIEFKYTLETIVVLFVSVVAINAALGGVNVAGTF